MGITAISGPQLVYGITQTSTGGTTEYNEERGPSLFDLGVGIPDPRYYFNYDPGNPVGSQVKGFMNDRALVDYVPYATNSSAISMSSATVPAAGVALTLVPYSSNGAFQTTIVAPESGQTVSVIAIDSTANVLTFGSGGTIAIWNSNAGTGRCISLTKGSTDATALVYTVNGRDMYGIKMTETITASTQSSVGTGRKAFKYISSIIPATTTINSTGIGVGFVDTFGFPLRCTYLGMDTVVHLSTSPLTDNTIPLSSVQVVLASSVATATSTTPDARGTYTSSIATTGSSASVFGSSIVGSTVPATRVQIFQKITAVAVSNVTATDTSALFGITQYSAV